MLTNKPLTVTEIEQIIAQLDTTADRLFLAGSNSLGNQLQEIVYCLEARREDLQEQ